MKLCTIKKDGATPEIRNLTIFHYTGWSSRTELNVFICALAGDCINLVIAGSYFYRNVSVITNTLSISIE